MLARFIGPLTAFVLICGISPAVATAVDCTCPFYFYGGGPGGYYCWAYHHTPDCPTSESVAATVPNYLFGDCANNCLNCIDNAARSSSDAEKATSDCCGNEPEATTTNVDKPKGLRVFTVAQSKEEPVDRTEGRLQYPFDQESEKGAIPVPSTFSHADFHPGPSDKSLEELNVTPFGRPQVLKYSPTGDGKKVKYLTVLLYQNINDAFPGMPEKPVSLLIGFAFEMKPNKHQQKSAPWLLKGMVNKMPESEDRIKFYWGALPVIGFVQNNSEWMK